MGWGGGGGGGGTIKKKGGLKLREPINKRSAWPYLAELKLTS